MRTQYRVLVLLCAGALVYAAPARAQDDSQSLGDVARQARQQKQKDAQADKDKDAPAPAKDAAKDAPSKDAQGKDLTAKDAQPPKQKKVITNDEIPSHIGPTSNDPGSHTPNVNYPQQNYGNNSPAAADQIKSSILQMKNYIASQQTQIADLEKSVHYSGGGCVSGCLQWNERQRQKQEQVEVMKQQLAEQQKNLERMQEMARRQGFGSSVYDP